MTTVNKNVYFNILDDIIDKYNNTYHKTIKMKPKDVTSDFFLLSIMKNLMKQTLNLK